MASPPRIALLVEYLGHKFCGSQFQVGVPTVQAELEKALSAYCRAPISCVFAGRTDSGVHARGQVVHFDWPAAEDVDLWRLTWALNGICPDGLSVTRAEIVPAQFHARYSAISRQYVYKILNRPQRSALLADTHFFCPWHLDLDAMRQALAALAGCHDFSSFKSTNSDRVNTNCRIERAELLKLAEGQLEFWIKADHFVYNMVRIIVGTLVEIGLGKSQGNRIEQALACSDRHLAGPTAPSWGLCLDRVEYPQEFSLFRNQECEGREILLSETRRTDR